MHHKEHFLTLSFFVGFIIDNLTLRRIDQLYDDVILTVYILVAMVSMALLYATAAKKMHDTVNDFLHKAAPFCMQYAFGGLFSGMLIFYGRSGPWIDSWPLLIVLIAVIYANETIKDRVQSFVFGMFMLFVGLYAYTVLMVPLVISRMGPVVFVASGVLALVIILMYVQILSLIVPRFIALHKRLLYFVIGVIFVGFNVLYFENIIPPIPLTLKEVGIFESVIHFSDNNTYQLQYEKGAWWQFYKKSDDVVHTNNGAPIYCYAKVYAPTQLKTDIYHVWERYDNATHSWVQYYRTSYPITHVNNDGYRGYTLITHYTSGTWRCSIETARGQVLGRQEFTIDTATPPGELVTRTE